MKCITTCTFRHFYAHHASQMQKRLVYVMNTYIHTCMYTMRVVTNFTIGTVCVALSSTAQAVSCTPVHKQLCCCKITQKYESNSARDKALLKALNWVFN